MTLRYPYKQFPLPYPVVSLGGRRGRARPIIGVTVIGPSDSRLLEGLLDSGADDTVFPEALAVDIGVDLSNAPARQFSTADRTAHPVRYVKVTLRLFDGVERREWPAWVGFSPARLKQPLLGIAGFLQFFDTNLRGAQEVAELTVNSSYPGT
jgi:hypothetical protein